MFIFVTDLIKTDFSFSHSSTIPHVQDKRHNNATSYYTLYHLVWPFPKPIFFSINFLLFSLSFSHFLMVIVCFYMHFASLFFFGDECRLNTFFHIVEIWKMIASVWVRYCLHFQLAVQTENTISIRIMMPSIHIHWGGEEKRWCAIDMCHLFNRLNPLRFLIFIYFSFPHIKHRLSQQQQQIETHTRCALHLCSFAMARFIFK